jgi:hypothetical protein
LYVTRAWVLAVGVKHLCSEDWEFVDEGMDTTIRVRELALHPTREPVVDKPYDPNGKILCVPNHMLLLSLDGLLARLQYLP